MGQCAGRTQKGEQCRREAREGSSFCSIHQEQASRPRAEPVTAGATTAPSTEPDWLKAALGFGILAAIVLFRIRR